MEENQLSLREWTGCGAYFVQPNKNPIDNWGKGCPGWHWLRWLLGQIFKIGVIGSELVREGLKSCQRLGHKIVVVVGHPDYYPRFGFVPAREKGLEVLFPVPDEAFMVFEFEGGDLDNIKGMIKYLPAFDIVEPN
ncbi:MAG: GNAT family N-acetyltransferase [Bacillota bacterium]